MADEIYVKEVTSWTARQSRERVAQAISTLSRMAQNGFAPYYSCNASYVRMFSVDTSSRVSTAYRRLLEIQTKLDAYISILDNGPDALLQIDADCKNELTTFWERSKRDLQGMFQYGVDVVEDIQNSLKTQILQWTNETPIGPALSFLMTSGETGYWLSIDDVKTKEDTRIYARQMAIKAGWGFITDVASIAGHISSFFIDCIKGDKVSAGSDVWELINDTYVTGYDLAALAIMPIGYAISKASGNDNIMITALKQATELEDNNDGLVDVLEESEKSSSGFEKEVYGFLKNSAKKIDGGSDAIQLYKGLKNTVELVNGNGSIVGELGYKDAKSTIKYDGVIRDTKGNDVTKQVIDEIEETSNMVNHISTTVEYSKAATEDYLGITKGSFGKKIYEKTSIGKSVKYLEKIGKIYGVEVKEQEKGTENNIGVFSTPFLFA